MASKSEPDLVDAGFEALFGKIYEVFAQSYGSATSPDEQKASIATFRKQVEMARDTRDAAKKSLP